MGYARYFSTFREPMRKGEFQGRHLHDLSQCHSRGPLGEGGAHLMGQPQIPQEAVLPLGGGVG